MVTDLDFGVVIEAVDTVRDPDGLALSSRNCRLSSDGRRTALAISRALRAVAERASAGLPEAMRAGRQVLDDEPRLVLDYLTLVDADTFVELSPSAVGPAIAVAAAEIEGVRLIDNMRVNIGTPGGRP